MKIARDIIVKDLNQLLQIDLIPEQNGLQVEGTDKINKIIFGVSASKALFEIAVKEKAQMIIVHHGLFWGHEHKITGVFGSRIKYLIKNDLNLLAYHLPLDKHPKFGNNIGLSKLLGLKNLKPFGTYKGLKIGFIGTLPKAESFGNIFKTLGGEGLNFGPKTIKTVAIVSGGAHDMLEEAIDHKADLYICGSRDEYVQELAREGKINFIAMGHYNSEKLGVLALKNYIEKKYKISTKFIDIKNPF
ncbi:MAG: Nif3-like dinuclear metal center hexameric protein [Elusimicrobiaceae bacterium]|nr:Nif3-like dinuclear metal center hexameric protein [Elusimicrobiaceae bacterium]